MWLWFYIQGRRAGQPRGALLFESWEWRWRSRDKRGPQGAVV